MVFPPAPECPRCFWKFGDTKRSSPNLPRGPLFKPAVRGSGHHSRGSLPRRLNPGRKIWTDFQIEKNINEPLLCFFVVYFRKNSFDVCQDRRAALALALATADFRRGRGLPGSPRSLWARPVQSLRSVAKVQLSHGPGVLTPTPAGHTRSPFLPVRTEAL